MTPHRPRVALIGPVLPFRGGIAQHTTMLHRALAGMAEVTTFSFTRQYPKVLFPGASDRDPAFAGHLEPGVRYEIDSVDPRTWCRAVREILDWDPDMVLLPWWTVFWAPCFSYVSRRLRRVGITVVFLCHNVLEHEQAWWKRALSRRVLAAGSAFAVHTHTDERHLLEMFPGASVAVYPHPAHESFPRPAGVLPPEHDLELLFFGFVRPYKGLDVLIEAMALLPEDLDVRLTIAGEFWEGEDETRERVRDLGLEGSVEFVSRYIGEADVAEYFARADAVVLPYRSATGSAVVAVAYAYGTPVLVTNVGGLPEVVVEGETGWVVEPDSPRALAAGIEAVTRESSLHMTTAIRRYVDENMTWDGLARAVLGVGGARTESSADRPSKD